jgi:hypothetical protein
MLWRNLMIAATCVGIASAAGCDSLTTVSNYLTLQGEPSVSDRLIDAPVEQVQLNTQSTLSSLGYVATVSHQGEEVRISSKNSYGYKFAVILTSVKTREGQRTRARIEWETGRDDQTSVLILAQLEKVGQKSVK